jgi:hypothetical protein
VPVLKDGLKRFVVTSTRIRTAPTSPVEVDSSSNDLIAAAVEVHRQMGPGLLRSAYEACFTQECASAEFHSHAKRRCP